MNPSIRRLLVLVLAPIVALSVIGCAKKSLAPTAPRTATLEQSGSGALLANESDCLRPARGGWANFFPLDSGDVWTYAREFRVAIVPSSDSSEIGLFDYHATVEARMLGPRVLGGVSYTLERDVETGEGGSFVTSIYYRQDAHGLYEADVSPSAAGSAPVGTRALASRAILPLDRLPLAAARRAWDRALSANRAKLAAFEQALRSGSTALPAGVTPPPPPPPPPPAPPPPPPPGSPGAVPEIQRLAYPLHPGQHWAIRDEPGFHLFATVEAPDVVRVRFQRLFAWRIRYDLIGTFGPNDHAHVWYGRDGFLGLRLHAEEPAVDESGNVIGVAISDEIQRITSLSLVGAHRGLAFDADR
jgi:hypothetical protein